MEIFHIGVPRSFLGVPNAEKGAKYVVVSAPYDSTVSYGTGTRNGPSAIIEASRQVETYDIALGRDFADCGIYTLDELECNRGSPEKNTSYVKEAISEILKDGKVPVLLGGEHSVSIGAFQAISEKFGNEVSVLQVDAHADMRQEYEGTKYDHACAMSRCRELLHAVSVGIRSYSEEEAIEIRKKKLDIFGADFDARKVSSKLKKKVYVTIDLDGIDPSECPAVGTPEPGGISYNKLAELLERVSQDHQIVGFDIVELAPMPGNHISDFLAARLAYKLICLIEAKKG